MKLAQYKYAVLGSGRQGIAAGYDLVKFGNAAKLKMLDVNQDAANSGALRINTLLKCDTAIPGKLDVNDEEELIENLREIDVCISAVPYKFNPQITNAAVISKTSFVDLGGHTENVRKQLNFHQQAVHAGITIVPDCGMGPGMNITLALLAMEQMDEPKEVRIWDGGLPQQPEPPWNYNLFFHINGLTNEYDGNAFFIRNGKISPVSCFEDVELIEFHNSVGVLEAAVTSGGLSTMPWTYEDKLDLLENKTLRYPGHWEWMKAYRELGLFSESPVKFDDKEIIPREFYHKLLDPKINAGIVNDICLMRVECKGKRNGKQAVSIVESVEYFDEKTEFTAMEKWTGWHASMMAIHIAEKKKSHGAYPVESAMSGNSFLKEAEKRNYNIIISNRRTGQ